MISLSEHSVPSRYAPGPQDLIVEDVFDNARRYPDRVAVHRRVAEEWLPITCFGLAADVEALAAGLLAAGLGTGERVALMCRTRYEWLLYDLAILSIGAVTVPIFETSSTEQVRWILADSEAAAVIVETDDQVAVVASLRADLPALREVWQVEADRFRLIEAGFSIGHSQVTDLRDTMGPDSPATIVYTSGTTGQPKGCVLTHGNLLALMHNVLDADGIAEHVFNDQQTTLLFLPLAHILARTIQFSALHAGVQLAHADMAHVAEDLHSFRPTVLLAVPRVFEKIYNTARQTAAAADKLAIFDKAESVALAYSLELDAGGPGVALRAEHTMFDQLLYRHVLAAMGGRVRWAVSGGAPLGSHLNHLFRGMGLNILEGYGLTETTAGGTLNLPAHQRIGSAGRPIPGCSLRIAEDGEILMKGPHVFAGYWHNNDATTAVLSPDGWLSTGDVGHLDHDGYLFITGRKKDLLVTSGGKNVAPAGLEDLLREHWLISQAFVVGDARPYIAALLTVDQDALTTWKTQHGRPANEQLSALLTRPELHNALQEAVDQANATVSHAEAIKRWIVLPHDFTQDHGELTPTLKVRRQHVTTEYSDHIERLYT
jgi:long-chain acyl-CoA synthetase